MLKKLLLLSVFVFLSCEGEDGAQGEVGAQGGQGEQGIEGVQGITGLQGINEPIIEDFTTLLDDFENGLSVNTSNVESSSADWSIQQFDLPTNTALTEIETQLNIDNSEILNGGSISTFNNFQDQNNINQIQQSNVLISGFVNSNESSSIDINLGVNEERTLLLFDAYVNGDRFEDFLFWDLNGVQINGISGDRRDEQNVPQFAGPFKVAFELPIGVDNTLTLRFRRGFFSSSFFNGLGAIDNLRTVNVDEYLEALEEFRNLNLDQ